ncbi:hypothetical protein L9F63_003723, partial [Diploptera punctata]
AIHLVGLIHAWRGDISRTSLVAINNYHTLLREATESVLMFPVLHLAALNVCFWAISDEFTVKVPSCWNMAVFEEYTPYGHVATVHTVFPIHPIDVPYIFMKTQRSFYFYPRSSHSAFVRKFNSALTSTINHHINK